MRRTSSRPHLLALLAAGVAAAAVTLSSAPANAAPEAAAQAAAAAPVTVVQLGDSYSAGNGARDPEGNAAYDAAVPNCYRSAYNYGQQFATEIGATYVNAACSGGVFADIQTPDTEAGVPAQIDAVDQNADVVLMTMGGNDIGFTNIVVQCFVLRSGDGCRNQIETAVAALPQLEESAYAEISAVRAKMRPDAAFIYLGYPNLTSAESLVLPTLDGQGYDAVAGLNELMTGGAAVQSAAVDRVNADSPCGQRTYYLDTVDEAFAGHEIDQSNPVVDPTTWFWNVGETLTIAESYHPKPAGWAAEAQLVSELYTSQIQSVPALTATPPSTEQGTEVEVSGTGFRSGDAVQVVLDPDIDTVLIADQCGAIAGTITLSPSTPVGTRTVTATSTVTGASAAAEFTVTAVAPTSPTDPPAGTTPPASTSPAEQVQVVESSGGSTSHGQLANTGAGEIGDYAATAVGLTVLGAVFVVAGRRRRV